MTPAFGAAAAALAKVTSMTETQARGTIRLALKSVGVDPRIARREDLLEVFPKMIELVASYRLVFDAAASGFVRSAIEAAPETRDDALAFFDDID